MLKKKAESRIRIKTREAVMKLGFRFQADLDLCLICASAWDPRQVTCPPSFILFFYQMEKKKSTHFKGLLR